MSIAWWDKWARDYNRKNGTAYVLEEKMDKKVSFRDLVDMESGTILEDWVVGRVRCIIMRGPASLCAYVGVKDGEPLWGKGYEEISLDVHYGLTFARNGDDSPWPSGWWWYGWDYAHLGDLSFYDFDRGRYEDIPWEPDMIRDEVENAARELAEKQGRE